MTTQYVNILSTVSAILDVGLDHSLGITAGLQYT